MLTLFNFNGYFIFLVIRCGYVSSPTNGKIHITKVSYGGVATFQCDDGYDLIGPTSRTCGLDGKWSKTNPECNSHVSCPKIQLNPNSIVIYATEKGRLPLNLTTFKSGTLAEIQCNENTSPIGENLITCLKDGTWDNGPPECLLLTKQRVEDKLLTKTSIQSIRPDKTFWVNLHSYLFFGCSPTEKTKRSLLCDHYNSNFTDLTTLSTIIRGQSLTFSSHDHQLLELLHKTLASIYFPSIDLSNFFHFILYQNETNNELEPKLDESTENSFRLMLCFYIYALSFDDLEEQTDKEPSFKFMHVNYDDTGVKIKQLLRQIVQQMFVKFLQPTETIIKAEKQPSNAIQVMIASKKREEQEKN